MRSGERRMGMGMRIGEWGLGNDDLEIWIGE